MSDVLLRRLAILKSIPVYPRKVSTRQLFSYLENNGYSTTIRTIQRDLEYLSGSGIFGIGVDSDSKPAGWYWLKESKTVMLPNLDIPTAIAYKMMSGDAARLFPQSILGHLSPFFEQADQLLNNRSEWNNKIVWTTSATKQYLSGVTDTCSREAIYEALEKGVCIAAEFGRFFGSAELRYIQYDCIHPLGILLSENISYLIARLDGSNRVYYFPVHPIKNVVLINMNITFPEGVNIKGFIDRHPLTIVFQKNVDLILNVDCRLANYLVEHPIGEGQRFLNLKNKRYQVSVTADDTSTLRTMMLSFGSSMTVIKPEKLKAFIQVELKKALDGYVYDNPGLNSD
ncbi:helix-turn-helix transcriptional regulator [Alkalimarinus alittae]|uniref:WYL domain-containing protein n=1 Tax=Alkalimarinus alittae TaxID=2961619 RepID=A0ABY6MX71_9ALTE|nr:WYL domain-containing protein [Alkalimarinus alittae]UZE94424.1 WYL domain-containing protein [Alkalimarinus alittae]